MITIQLHFKCTDIIKEKGTYEFYVGKKNFVFN